MRRTPRTRRRRPRPPVPPAGARARGCRIPPGGGGDGGPRRAPDRWRRGRSLKPRGGQHRPCATPARNPARGRDSPAGAPPGDGAPFSPGRPRRTLDRRSRPRGRPNARPPRSQQHGRGTAVRIHEPPLRPRVSGARPHRQPTNAPVAQWIEHQTSDLRVGGSNPSRRANFRIYQAHAERSNLLSRRAIAAIPPPEPKATMATPDLPLEIEAQVLLARELRSLEYKASMPWGDSGTRAKIAKACMAMSNLRDGGLVVLEVDGPPIPARLCPMG